MKINLKIPVLNPSVILKNNRLQKVNKKNENPPPSRDADKNSRKMNACIWMQIKTTNPIRSHSTLRPCGRPQVPRVDTRAIPSRSRDSFQSLPGPLRLMSRDLRSVSQSPRQSPPPLHSVKWNLLSIDALHSWIRFKQTSLPLLPFRAPCPRPRRRSQTPTRALRSFCFPLVQWNPAQKRSNFRHGPGIYSFWVN